MTGRQLHELIRREKQDDDSVYILADAARNYGLVRSSWVHHQLDAWSLFGDRTPQHMTRVAPYLIPLDFEAEYPYPASGFLDQWAKSLGDNAGIVLVTQAGRHRMRDHVRRVFEVADEDGNEFFFRYYDPRVLRAYLPTCRPDETKEFFGPVQTMIVEGQSQNEVLLCNPSTSGVRIRSYSPPAQQD